MALLHLLRWLKDNATFDIEVLIRQGGPLFPQFRALAPTWTLARIPWRRSWRDAPSILRSLLVMSTLARRHFDLIYSNTIANGNILSHFRSGIPVISHVHELGYSIQHYGERNLRRTVERTSRYIACSNAVRENLANYPGINVDTIDVVHGFIESPASAPRDLKTLRQEFRAELGIPDGASIVGGCGTMEWRKGVDLFVQMAGAVCRRHPEPVHFAWIGGAEPTGKVMLHVPYDVHKLDLTSRFHFLGQRPNADRLIGAFDVFALTSREDPFPLVCLEAAAAGIPLVYFERTGGIGELVESDSGLAAPYLDVAGMAHNVISLLRSASLRSTLGQTGAAKVRMRHQVSAAGSAIAGIIEEAMGRQRSSIPRVVSPVNERGK